MVKKTLPHEKTCLALGLSRRNVSVIKQHCRAESLAGILFYFSPEEKKASLILDMTVTWISRKLLQLVRFTDL